VRAITVAPGERDSQRLDDLPEPDPVDGSLLVQTVALGICGTDAEILNGSHGASPPGRERMVLGHESLGRVLEAPDDSGFSPGDRVVGIVRRPDPVPCRACSHGEWDMCENGLYSERGIKGRDGYGAERFRLAPAFAVKVDPGLGLSGVLLEPTSVVAKAWDHIDRIGHRTRSWAPRRVLITGAGPVGLLAALLARQRGFDTHVYDRVEDGLKPALVRELGATYHHDGLEALTPLAPDIVVECTGAGPVVLAMMQISGRNGIVCLTGLSSGGRKIELDAAGLNRSLVLENDVIFGSVNANRTHYELAAEALAGAEPAWLNRVISRRVPLTRWREAYQRQPDDVKVVIDFEATA
tara:strand:+ start:6342 stop:7400 length:1059 start_codon:yes stop_codon:yes gene_type:complete